LPNPTTRCRFRAGGDRGVGNMATAPTLEDAAREILRLLVHDHGLSAGEVIRTLTISSALMPPVWPSGSANAGFQYAQSKDWLEAANSPAFIKLTQAGFDEA
jgi:hypothetical protein